MGSDFWQNRLALNALYRAGNMNAYRAAKRHFFESNRTEIRRRGDAFVSSYKTKAFEEPPSTLVPSTSIESWGFCGHAWGSDPHFL